MQQALVDIKLEAIIRYACTRGDLANSIVSRSVGPTGDQWKFQIEVAASDDLGAGTCEKRVLCACVMGRKGQHVPSATTTSSGTLVRVNAARQQTSRCVRVACCCGASSEQERASVLHGQCEIEGGPRCRGDTL
jgi:hypothetical protein